MQLQPVSLFIASMKLIPVQQNVFETTHKILVYSLNLTQSNRHTNSQHSSNSWLDIDVNDSQKSPFNKPFLK